MVLYGFLFLSFSATLCLFLSVHLLLCLCQFFIILSMYMSLSISLFVSFFLYLSVSLCPVYLSSLSACRSISLLLSACFFVCMNLYQFQLLFLCQTDCLFLFFSHSLFLPLYLTLCPFLLPFLSQSLHFLSSDLWYTASANLCLSVSLSVCSLSMLVCYSFSLPNSLSAS